MRMPNGYAGSIPARYMPKRHNKQNGGNNMNRIMLIALIAIMMIASPISGAVVTEEVEIRGTVVSGNGTYEYDYASFAGFWYSLDKDQSSETMNITVTGERTREHWFIHARHNG